jgi:hypothetical protein
MNGFEAALARKSRGSIGADLFILGLFTALFGGVALARFRLSDHKTALTI